MTTLTEYGRRLTEQARRLDVHPNTIQRWIRRHGLVATFVGGVWHVRDEDLDRFFAERTAARLNKPVPVDTRAHAAADRALSEAGW
jgi:excisionase family DNA binding protein